MVKKKPVSSLDHFVSPSNNSLEACSVVDCNFAKPHFLVIAGCFSFPFSFLTLIVLLVKCEGLLGSQPQKACEPK